VVPNITFVAKPVLSTSTPNSKSISDFENKKVLNQNASSGHTIKSLPVEITSCPTAPASLPVITHAAIGSQAISPSTADIGVIQNIITHPVDSLLPHVITPGLPTSTTKLINSVSATSTHFSLTPSSTSIIKSTVARNILKPATTTNVQQPAASCASSQPHVDPIPEVIPDFQTG
jgi:hypothetical protein